jgi:hypothetical protein
MCCCATNPSLWLDPEKKAIIMAQLRFVGNQGHVAPVHVSQSDMQLGW